MTIFEVGILICFIILIVYLIKNLPNIFFRNFKSKNNINSFDDKFQDIIENLSEEPKNGYMKKTIKRNITKNGYTDSYVQEVVYQSKHDNNSVKGEKCPNCGAPIKEVEDYCEYCKTKIK